MLFKELGGILDKNCRPTCSVADVQVHHVLLVHEEHAEVVAAGGQHGLVGLEVDAVHHEGAVAEQPQLPLLVQLLQHLLAVLREIHGCGEGKKPGMGGEVGGETTEGVVEEERSQNTT